MNKQESDKLTSTKWINEFAASIEQTPTRLMNAAERWLQSGGEAYTYDNDEYYKNISTKQWDEFWRHYEKVVGHKITNKPSKYSYLEDLKTSFFTCSC